MRSATVVSSEALNGSIPFVNPGAIAQEDDVYAQATATLTLLNSSSQNLKATGFGFTIPQNATICGVEMKIKKVATGINLLASVTDNQVKLVKADALAGADRSVAANWTLSKMSTTYGSPTDTWGTNLTAEDVNSPNFGIAYSARIKGLVSLLPSANVDVVHVVVHYNVVMPVKLSDFDVRIRQQHAELSWALEGPSAGEYIVVERSLDGVHWHPLHKEQVVLHGQLRKAYRYTDRQMEGPADHHYRLRLVGTDGQVILSGVRKISGKVELAGGASLFPNPVTSLLHIHCREAIRKLQVFSSTGVAMQSAAPDGMGNTAAVDMQSWPRGVYFVRLNDEIHRVNKL